MKAHRPISALRHLPELKDRLAVQEPIFFLDYDGTLAPIVQVPQEARMLPQTRTVLAALAAAHPVCVISGRPLDFLSAAVGLDTIYLAADHGHRILGPDGTGVDLQVGEGAPEDLGSAVRLLEEGLGGIPGILFEAKEVSVAVHYRSVARQERPAVRQLVDRVLEEHPGLRLLEGKMVYELLPDMGWGKGDAVRWLLDHFSSQGRDLHPVCVGDDLTDEDMFSAVATTGITIVVGDHGRPTRAAYKLRDAQEVPVLLQALTNTAKGPRGRWCRLLRWIGAARGHTT